jgi:hypothetical protein
MRAPVLPCLRQRNDRTAFRHSLVVRFPPRRIRAVVICRARDGDGWLAIVNGHGWVFGSLADAQLEARWLARNLNLPIAESSP